MYCEENTDFTKCIGIEQDGSPCIRIRRNGDYCWYHDPENPQVCHKCNKKLKVKQNIVVNGRMKEATGLFEECDCQKPIETETESKTIDEVDPTDRKLRCSSLSI